MKTPRELILERHQSAEAKLKSIRAEDLAAYARLTAETKGGHPSPLSLAVIAQHFWQETLWPWRRVWAGVAASWLVILGLGLATGDTPGTAAIKPARPDPEVLAVLRQQEQLLTQLLGTEAPQPGLRPRTPGPHSAAEPLPATEEGASRRETRLRPETFAQA